MKKLLVTLFCVIGMAMSQSANALSLTYNLTSDHCTDGCLTGQTSGGTVTVTDNGTGTLAFNVLLLNGNKFVNTGFDATFGFNLTGIGAVTYSGLSSGFDIPPMPANANPQLNGDLHMDGTGFFDFGVLWHDQGGGAADPNPLLTFTVAAAGLDIQDLVQNANGQYFAVDIISGTTGKTGGIDASTSTVPDGGSTATLLGSALFALSMVARKFRKS